MKQSLSPRQGEVLDAIRRLTTERGFPPTVRELGNAIGVRSTNAIADHLRALHRKGWMRSEAGVARSMVLTGDDAPPAPESAGPRRIPGRPGHVVLEIPAKDAVCILGWLRSRLTTRDLGTVVERLVDELRVATGG